MLLGCELFGRSSFALSAAVFFVLRLSIVQFIDELLGAFHR